MKSINNNGNYCFMCSTHCTNDNGSGNGIGSGIGGAGCGGGVCCDLCWLL